MLRVAYFGRQVTPSIERTIRSATATSTVSAPSAASLRQAATYRHVSFSRHRAGRCPISLRTSASVASVGDQQRAGKAAGMLLSTPRLPNAIRLEP